MSDAPAAPVTENGVPPAAQETVTETPEFKVFAGNLSYSTTDEGLKAFFAPVQSEILSAQIVMRGPRSAGYGFVALSTAEAAENAVELLNKQELDGRHVIIEIAKPLDQKTRKERRFKRRPGRRGGKAVPGEVTEAEANGEAPRVDDDAAADAPASSAPRRNRRKKKGPRKPKAPKSEGETPVDASAPEAQGDAQPAEAPKKAPRPRRTRAPRPEGEDPAGEPSKTVLFVANLGFNVDDAGLSSIFTEAGITVVTARIVRRRFGRFRKSKGYGFVDVGSEEEQKKAIELLQDKDVGGRPIAVKIAVNTQHEDNDENIQAPEAAAPAPAPAAAAAV
jgi:RNA recognition motif-containing protein